MHALHVPRSPKSLRCVRGSDIVSPELQHCIDNSPPAEAKNLPLPIERMHSSHRDRNPIEIFFSCAPIPLFMTVNATHSLLVKGVDSQSWLRKWLTLYIKWKCPLSSEERIPLGVACGVRRGESKSDYLAQLSPRLLWPGVDSAKSKIYIFPETCHYYFVGDFEGRPFAELLIAVINTTPWGGQVSTILWCPPYHGVHPSMVSTQPSSSNFDKQPGGRNAHRRCQITCFLLSFFFVEIISCKKVQVNCVWIESRQIMTGCDHWYGRQQKRREIGSKSYNLVTISPWLQNLGRTGDLFTETVFWFKLLSYLQLISENGFCEGETRYLLNL